MNPGDYMYKQGEVVLCGLLEPIQRRIQAVLWTNAFCSEHVPSDPITQPCPNPLRFPFPRHSLPKKVLHRMRADIVIPILVAGQTPPGLHEEGAVGSRGRVRRHGDLVLALARHIDLARLVEVGSAERVLDPTEAVLADGDGEAHSGYRVGWLVGCYGLRIKRSR